MNKSTNRMHVMTILGTRPEIIRLSRVIPELDQSFFHTLVHTGQNYDYELSDIFFDDLSLRRPDYYLGAARTSSAETIGEIISRSDKLLRSIKPDAILILGDTNSCLSSIAAKRLKIPIFHIEAGNRCFDLNVPEEINRKIVDHISDVNITYSELARQYLINEGIPADRVIHLGSPMGEVINYYKNNFLSKSALEKLNVSEGNYFMISIHREENTDTDDKIDMISKIFKNLVESYQIPIVVSAHPRVRSQLERKFSDQDHDIKICAPFSFSQYHQLQRYSRYVLSDSGTISEEASLLGFSALNLRENHERPEAMEQAAVLMSGLRIDRIRQGLDLLDRQRASLWRSQPVADYIVPDFSTKVVRIIQSYRDYVMRYVWHTAP